VGSLLLNGQNGSILTGTKLGSFFKNFEEAHKMQRIGFKLPRHQVFSRNHDNRSIFPGESAALERVAASFPSMGGREIGPFLREITLEAPEDTSIVELGSWLGAGTAQLALGIVDRGPKQHLEIHCYDRWAALPDEVSKARKAGISLREGQDTLPNILALLEPFPVSIHFHKGDLARARWNGEPISIYVDDACKKPSLFFHALRTFGPSWIPGKTVVVLMDFHFWKKAKSKSYRCQREFIDRYRDHFEIIDRDYFEGSTWAAFRYVRKIEFNTVKRHVFPDLVRKLFRHDQ
jgi:hypothetical protein